MQTKPHNLTRCVQGKAKTFYLSPKGDCRMVTNEISSDFHLSSFLPRLALHGSFFIKREVRWASRLHHTWHYVSSCEGAEHWHSRLD